jgi:hypothetical protein
LEGVIKQNEEDIPSSIDWIMEIEKEIELKGYSTLYDKARLLVANE